MLAPSQRRNAARDQQIFIDGLGAQQALLAEPLTDSNGEKSHQVIQPHPLRVLCADDNVLVLDMLAKTLESAGHHVEVATDGRAAVTRVAKDPNFFQLIVTDTRMPSLDGFGVVQEARSAGYQGRIIVFANSLSPEDRQRYKELRVDRVIDKPGKSGELVGAVRELHALLCEPERAAG
jgi:CheY-like chemotaxis protein